MLTKKQVKDFIFNIKANDELEKKMGEYYDLFFDGYGIPIYNEYLIEAIKCLVSDIEWDWLTYYMWECDFGKEPKLCGYNDVLIELDNIDKLYDVMYLTMSDFVEKYFKVSQTKKGH